MTDPVELLDQSLARESRAFAEVTRLCEGGRWTMRVPVDEDRDSDVVIVASLTDVLVLVDALRAVLALADELAAKCPPGDWGDGGIDDAIQADTGRTFRSAVTAALAADPTNQKGTP